MSQCALSYMREGDKAERRLEKLQTEALEVTQVHLTSIAPPAEQPAAPVEETMAQTEQPAVRAEESESQTEQPAVQAEAPVPPKTNIPAYKLLKQARRQQKQLDRDARMQAKAQSPALPPDLSIAA
jgi:aryl-alcohol dehydrogenase-like predicted oxidoreductase